MTELERKKQMIAAVLEAEGLDAVVLRGLDWFSWATCGASAQVLLAAETGIADIVVTREGRMRVRTDEIEAERLRQEELLQVEVDFEVRPWIDAVPSLAGRIASDRPQGSELALPDELVRRKRILGSEEVERLRRVGRLAALAMDEALARSRPEWTEQELAAEGARALLARGVDPSLVLSAGARRLEIYRHPLPKPEPLGRKTMLVFCARKHGLYANLTRIRFFDEKTPEEKHGLEVLAAVEESALRMSAQGLPLGEIYRGLAGEYARFGLADEIRKHHQGGITGYLPREEIARPTSTARVEPGMSVAWNPSLPGLKKEDTVLIHPGSFEVVTASRGAKEDTEGKFHATGQFDAQP